MSWLDATADLLAVARATLRERVMPGLQAENRHGAAMVANALAIASRELGQGGRARAEEQALLGALYGGPPASLDALRRRLCRDLRAGGIADTKELRDLLDRLVRARLAISNPDYPASYGREPD